MLFENDIEKTWNSFYKTLKKLVIFSISIILVFYLSCLLLNLYFLAIFPLIYLLCCAIYREIYWLSDQYTSQVIGYESMKVFLWRNIVKPPTTVVWIKMWVIWSFLFRPAYECRVRKLSSYYHSKIDIKPEKEL